MKHVLNYKAFITQEKFINENINNGYTKWKRKNVTIRGIKELGKTNNVYGSYGKGLYTVPLSNVSMARKYGDIYFVVNAIPKNPKIVQYTNDAEIFIYNLIDKFCTKHDKEYNKNFFEANTSIEKEMLELGYDGLIIKGREMVNYTPSNIKYFKTENELQNYYNDISMVLENKITQTILSVDIQPGHQDGIHFDLDEYADYINNNTSNNIIFMFNGEDLGYESLEEYQSWLFDIGVEEDVIENAIFIEKSYGFFRYPIDYGIEENSIADLVRYLYDNNINNSYELDEDTWDDFVETTDSYNTEIRDLLEFENFSSLSIPDLMDDLKKYYNYILVGGDINQCLKEIEIALLALDKQYEIYRKFTY